MILVSIVTSCILGFASSHRVQSNEAKSFLRTRRATSGGDNSILQKDDPAIFNYREDWENFKDFLEPRSDIDETDIDKLESCISECRKEDYKFWGGNKFTQLKEAFDNGESETRPFPCDTFNDRANCVLKSLRSSLR